MDYGVYNTIAGFVTMFAFLNSTLSASVQRFYNYEGVKNNEEGYRNVYSVAIIVHFVVILAILLILETIGVWYVNNMMVIPGDRLPSANVIFQTSIVSLCLLVLSIPYSGAVLAAEKMDFYAIVSILDTFLKLLCVLSLPYLPYDKLSTYGMLLMVISVINFLIYFVYAKKHILKFRLHLRYDKILLKQMLSFSTWNVVGTFAFMLKGQALNLLLNLFFGPLINAARGIAFQIGNAISAFSNNITVAFKPQMVISYSLDDNDRVNFLFSVQSKICFALIAILIIPVIFNINYILHIWLGSDIPKYSACFSIFVLIDALASSLNAPCTQVVSATGNIKGYQIASSCVNLFLLPACWFFLYLGFSPISTFIITILFTFINQVVCVWQMSKVFDINVLKYLTSIILPCLIFIFICAIIGFVLYLVIENSLARLCIITSVNLLIGVLLTYFVLLDKFEQKQIINLIKHR